MNGSTLAQSRKLLADPPARARAAGAGAAKPRGPTSTPTTRYQPSRRASSISFERTSRAPSTLISCRSSTSLRSSTSCGAPLEGPQVEPGAVRASSVPARSARPPRPERTPGGPATVASRPVTGGYSSSPSRTIRSSTRPSFAALVVPELTARRRARDGARRRDGARSMPPRGGGCRRARPSRPRRAATARPRPRTRR